MLLFPSAWVDDDATDLRTGIFRTLVRRFGLTVVNANWGEGEPRLRGQGRSRIVGPGGAVEAPRLAGQISRVSAEVLPKRQTGLAAAGPATWSQELGGPSQPRALADRLVGRFVVLVAVGGSRIEGQVLRIHDTHGGFLSLRGRAVRAQAAAGTGGQGVEPVHQTGDGHQRADGRYPLQAGVLRQQADA